jgi:hypothetical protein
MKLRQLSVLLILLLVLPVFLIHSFPSNTAAQISPDVYVGVDVAYGDLAATKQLIDRISSYSNLLVIGCTGVTYDVTKLNDVCQYIFDRNMYFIVFTNSRHQPLQQWFDTARNNWGSSFLGLYVDDEIGGKQLDQAENYATVLDASDYSDAEIQFNTRISQYLNAYSTRSSSTPMFTSDYALYWFDYKAGYDTVFAEFGWNYSEQLNVALCRGAATAQNKDWGVMITWTYTNPPYIESGEDLYKDMVLAYENGAKYIIVFDTNEDYSQSILGDEHFDAMNQFWQYVQNNPRSSNLVSDRSAYVLPEDYAYGFRGPKDKIWGLWEADDLSSVLCIGTNILLEQYGAKLDIVYEDALQPGNTLGYSNIVYWNDPAPVQQEWPDSSLTPFQSLSPIFPSSPTPTPTPSPSSSASPSLSSSPSISLSPSPTQQPTLSSSPDPQTGFFLPMGYLFGITAGIVAVVVLGLVVFFRKRP